MSIAFSRSMRKLEADGFGRSMFVFFFVAIFIVAWLAWLCLSQVSVYEVAESASLQESQLATGTLPDQIKIVARFPSTIALGRIRHGQAAQLSLDGFPKIYYGSLSAVVVNVDTTVQDGQVQVDLALEPDSTFPVALRHGMAGVVEIEIERVSPAILLLRAVGQRLAPPRATSTPHNSTESTP